MSVKKKSGTKNKENILIKKASSEIKWYYIFIFLLVYSFVVVRKCRIPSMEDVVYSFHAVDFSMGFCSRFLPGAIFNLIFKTPTILKATIYETVLLVGFFAVLSVFLSKISKSLAPDNRPAFLLLTLFFLTGPGTFSIYSYQIGMLDVYWMFFGAIFFVLLKNRYLRRLIPAVCFLCLMIHYSVILCYIPLFALIALYEADRSENRREKTSFFLLFTLICLVAVPSFFYFVLTDSTNHTYSKEQFDAILESRGAFNHLYYDTTAYASDDVVNNLIKDGVLTSEQAREYLDPIVLSPEKYHGIALLVNEIWKHIHLMTLLYSLDVYTKALIKQLVIYIAELPLIITMFRYFIARIKERKNKLTTFIFVCAVIYYPVISLMTPLLSSDTVRWMSHSFMVPFVFLMYCIYRDKDNCITKIKELTSKIPTAIKAVYLVIYSLLIFDPYILIG